MKILIAEDEVLMRESLTYFFRAKSHEVVPTDDGETALQLLKIKKFDLIITDLNMPKVGGMQLLHMIRNELHLDTPVIVLTSFGVEKTVLDAFAMGASEFISKPFSPSVLNARIQLIVKDR